LFTNVLNANRGNFGKNLFTLAFVIDFSNFGKNVTFRKMCKRLEEIGRTKKGFSSYSQTLCPKEQMAG